MSHKNTQGDGYLDFDSDGISQMKKETATDQLKLGVAYFNAYSIEDNCSNAFEWIKLSAEQGNMEAQFRLAELYSLGLGTSRSHTDAYKWYTKAAIQGYKKASIRIHNLYQEDIKMHCRGRLNSEEKHREKPRLISSDEAECFYRELNEQRLGDYKLVLNHAVEYYTIQFEKYRSSNQEDPEVQQNLGFLYQRGYGVKKYDKWAIEYFTKAAEQGCINSQYQLGCLYQQNTDIKFNYKKAFHWYRLAAEGENIASQNSLAYLYEKGLGTDIDYQKALYWYSISAESGHSGAQLNLGKWYRKGQYINQNYDTAIKWYSLAGRQGNGVAQNCLAQLYQTGKISHLTHVDGISEDYICGSKKGHLCSKLQSDIFKLNDLVLIENLKKLAKRALVGDGNSMYQIGLKYYYGIGLSEDKQIGFKWIKNGADSGHEEAIFRVNKMYGEGDTVEQDYHKVAIWTKKIARSKISKALCDLGILYNEGRGVRNDPLEASRWFTLSAEQGNSEAQYQLGFLRQEGRGLRKNEEEALKLFKLSAKQGNINGCYRFGLSLSNDRENGNEDVIKYDTTTINLLKYSSKKGCALAQYKLWKIYHDKEIKPEADLCFDILMLSNDVSVIAEMVEHAMYYNGVSVGYIKYFNLLKKAANLGITTAKNVFQSYVDFMDSSDLDHLVKLFTLISDKGISSMEHHIARIYENNFFIIVDEIKKAENDTRAVYWYDISAKKGDSRAQVKLGIFCEEGRVVDKDFAEAFKYYSLACEKGNKNAMYRLACMYLDGRGVSQDLEKAFQLFSQTSDMGHIEARKILMLPHNTLNKYSSEYEHYQNIAVEINDNNRVKMLENMAESGLVAIQYRLGIFYENKDDSKAVKWFTLAAQGGITDASYRVGILYEEGRGAERDYKKAISFYEKAIRNEHEDSMYRLAQMYLYGRDTEIDYKKAYGLYSRAAKIGHVLSYNILDFNLTSDESLSSNESNHTLLMLRYVAEEGDAESQYKLGYYYEHILNEQKYEEATKWYSMAVDNSHAEAMYRLGLLYETRSGAMQNYKKAIHLYNQAYKLGNYDALYRLGTVYQYGVVAKLDLDRAVRCYTEGANHGHLKSQHTLANLYEEELFTRKDILKALKWYTRAYLNGYDPARTDLYANYDDLPYEQYFFGKRNKVLLSVANSLLFSDIFEYQERYGLIFYKLGIDYLLGNGISQDYGEAWKCFQESEKICFYGPARSILNLEYDGDRDIFLRAVEMYEVLFDNLDSKQQCALGMLYYNGVSNTSEEKTSHLETMADSTSGVVSEHMIDKQNLILAKDYSKAIFYLEKVPPIGFIYDNPQLQVAEMYARGLGGEKNIKKVIEHYTKASNEPNYFAFEIAELYHFDNDFCDYSEAIEWYKKATENQYGYKYDIALNILGLIYRSGIGVKRDHRQALHYFEKAASRNNIYSCYNLGLIYYHGQGIRKNYSEAYKWFQTAALYGHAKAQMYLSNMYLNGCGVEKNFKEAKRWHSKASDSSNDDSENERIWVADIDYFEFRTEAIEWCKKIQENDPVISFNNTKYSDCVDYSDKEDCYISTDYFDNADKNEKIEEHTRSTHKEVQRIITNSVELCEGDSSYILGEMYYSGEGVQKDYNEAYAYFLKAAEKNKHDAQYMLAEMYRYGRGVGQDTEKAIELYKKVEGDKKVAALKEIGGICLLKENPQLALLYYKEASELGDSDILLELAKKYYNSEGVDQNINQAIQFYTEAANNNNDIAADVLGELYHFNNEIQDFSKAFEWYQKTQGSNTSYALRGIGLLFEYGDGVNQDYQKSVEYYQQSVQLGNKGGYYNLALLYYHGKGVDQDYERCLDLLNNAVKNELNVNCTYVFVRTENKSSASKIKENRIYSLENESILYGEIYYQLGIMHKNGQGTNSDDSEAEKCFLKAIDYGNEQAKDQIY